MEDFVTTADLLIDLSEGQKKRKQKSGVLRLFQLTEIGVCFFSKENGAKSQKKCSYQMMMPNH